MSESKKETVKKYSLADLEQLRDDKMITQEAIDKLIENGQVKTGNQRSYTDPDMQKIVKIMDSIQETPEFKSAINALMKKGVSFSWYLKGRRSAGVGNDFTAAPNKKE